MNKNERLRAFLGEYLPSVDRRIPTEVNMGGCASFALHLSDVLDKMHVKHSIQAIIFKNDSGFDEMQVSNLMRLLNTGRGDSGLAESHVAIEIDGELFDAVGSLCDIDGSFRADMPRIHKVITITKPVLLKQIQEGIWSPIYDKSQEPLLKRLIWEIPQKLYLWTPGEYKIRKGERKKLTPYTKMELVRESQKYPLMAVLAANSD